MANKNISNHYTDMINAIVFDLDETIGHFSQLYTIWETLQEICKSSKHKNTLHQDLFNRLLDAFDDYMRPLIMAIFNYLKNKKLNTKNVAVMIYTNNNGPKNWTLMIRDYIHYKLHYNLFDNVICAFKVNGKVIEPFRTTYHKTYSDLIRCTSIPRSAKIFFIDDQYHEKMKHENIYYIKIKPYIFEYTYEQILQRISNESIVDYMWRSCGLNERQLLYEFDKTYNKHRYATEMDDNEQLSKNIDQSVGKQIMKHLREFFFDVIETRQTRKHRRPSPPSLSLSHKNRTRKKYF